MRLISEWTDGELHQTGTRVVVDREAQEALAAEVLRLRGELAEQYTRHAVVVMSRDKAEEERQDLEAVAEKYLDMANHCRAELTRCRPVVDAALALASLPWGTPIGDTIPALAVLARTVNAYRAEEGN